jgi:hypothetical protein
MQDSIMIVCNKLGIKIARIQSDRGIECFEQEGIGKVYERAHSALLRALCNKNNIEHTVILVRNNEKFTERWNKEHVKTVDVARLASQFWTSALEFTMFISYQCNMFGSGHLIITILVKYQGRISGEYLVCDAFDLITNNKYAKLLQGQSLLSLTKMWGVVVI